MTDRKFKLSSNLKLKMPKNHIKLTSLVTFTFQLVGKWLLFIFMTVKFSFLREIFTFRYIFPILTVCLFSGIRVFTTPSLTLTSTGGGWTHSWRWRPQPGFQKMRKKMVRPPVNWTTPATCWPLMAIKSTFACSGPRSPRTRTTLYSFITSWTG